MKKKQKNWGMRLKLPSAPLKPAESMLSEMACKLVTCFLSENIVLQQSDGQVGLCNVFGGGGGGGHSNMKWRTSSYRRTKVGGIRWKISSKKGDHLVWAPQKMGSFLVWTPKNGGLSVCENTISSRNLQILC